MNLTIDELDNIYMTLKISAENGYDEAQHYASATARQLANEAADFDALMAAKILTYMESTKAKLFDIIALT